MASELNLDCWSRCARIILICLITAGVTGCGLTANRSGKSYVIKGKRYHIMASAEGYKEKGHASWYGEPFHGRKTASGEVYDMNRISAAHKTLPLHTWVEVKNLDNNKVMTLRINDRGPFVKGRIIDLSRAAAQEIGMMNSGVARVSVKAVTGRRAQQLAAEEKKTLVAAAPVSAATAKSQPAARPAESASGGKVKVASGGRPTARERAKKSAPSAGGRNGS